MVLKAGDGAEVAADLAGLDSSLGGCQVCGRAASSRCSACFQAVYCGQQHQKEDWKRHKSRCERPFEIVQNDRLGRYMVASRDLSPGDVIFRERPLLHGPNLEQSQTICTVCYKLLSASSFAPPCKKCLVPLCGTVCAQSPTHQNECQIIRQAPWALYGEEKKGTNNWRPNLDKANFQLILPLRALLLKRQNLKQFRQLLTLQSHHESDRGTPQEALTNERINRKLAHFRSGLTGSQPEDTLARICSIFHTNSFDLAADEGRTSVTGLYARAAMMAHACVKNTRITFTNAPDFVLTVHAREAIPRGQAIFHSYTRPLLPTAVRRLMLFHGKRFSCECRRCLDPREMGALTSALICGKCRGGGGDSGEVDGVGQGGEGGGGRRDVVVVVVGGGGKERKSERVSISIEGGEGSEGVNGGRSGKAGKVGKGYKVGRKHQGRGAKGGQTGAEADTGKDGRREAGLVLAENPIDLRAKWTCVDCGESELTGAQVAVLENRLYAELESLDQADPSALEAFLKKHENQPLHPRHGLIMLAKQALSVMLGKQGADDDDENDDMLKRKVDLCREVLDVVQIVEPGLATRLGLASYELASALRSYLGQSGRRLASSEAADLEMEAEANLRRASEILHLEPPQSLYGRLGARADAELKRAPRFAGKKD